MAEFFISPESQRALDRERYMRQQRFEQARTQVTPEMGQRLLLADRLNPQASNQLKQAYALHGLTDDEFLELSRRESERVAPPDDGGIFATIGNAIEGVGLGIWNQLVKPAVRGAMLAVDTAAQELVQRPLTSAFAAAKDPDIEFGEAFEQYGDSPLINALQARMPGLPSPSNKLSDPNRPEAGRFDVGRGFFPGGAAAETSMAERTLTINGQRASFGRAFAGATVGNFYSPGDAAYDITAGVTQFLGDVVLDPTAWATAGATKVISASKGLAGARTLGQARRGISISRANEAAEQLRTAGLVSTRHRDTVIFEQARRVLGNPKVLEDIAAADTYTIFRRMKAHRLGVGRASDEFADMIVDLGATTDPTEVGRKLIDYAQRGFVRERGFYKGSGRFVPNPKEMLRNVRLDKNLPEFRYGGVNPQRVASASNRMQAAIDVDAMLRLAKVGEADRAGIVTRTLQVNDNRDLLDVVDDAARTIGRKMEDVGVDPEDIEELLAARRESMNRMTSYLLDANGKHSPPPWKALKDDTGPSASMIVHFNQQMVPLFDPTDLRRATTKLSGLRKVYTTVGWDMGIHAAKAANKYLFKFPTLFTRLAYPVRNNLDNQARTAAAGYDSLFTNPIAWFSLGVKNPHKFREVVTDGAGNARSFDEVARETKALTNDAAGMWADDGARAIGNYVTYQRGDKGFVRAWRQQLGRFVNDPIAKRVADKSRWLDRDDLIDGLISDGIVDELAKLDDEAVPFFYRGGTSPDRGKVAEYVDYIEGHLDDLTGGDTGLRQLVASGQLNGVSFNDLRQNKRLNQILREQYFNRGVGPAFVSGDTFLEEGVRGKNAWKKAMDHWVDIMASRPENRFTRYPLLAQVFADDLARVMPALADDTLRQQLVRSAADAGFDDKLFGQIAQAAQNAAGQKGVLDNLEDVLDVAKMHSTDRMLDIAFDATQRSAFQEMADVVFPFWDAFVEVGTSWGRILKDNPAAFARGTAAIRSARGSGVFYVNEEGQEVFAYPGGGLLAKALGIAGGRPIFEGRVEGLNLVTQGIGPGFGPMVQWAAGAFMPETPDLQWVRDLVTPFGTSVESPSDLGDLGGLINDLTPAWMKKTLNTWADGDIDPVAYNSAVGDALKVLATTGAYPPNDPEAQRRLLADAEKAARWTTYLRAALQMGAPTGPSVEWEVRSDPDGVYHRVNVMASAYFEMLQQTGDEQAATMAFIDMYGVEPFWITQGKTRELREGPRTREGWNWIGRHADAAERHADVIGYFVPAEDPTAPPDYGVYRQRLNAGDLETLSADEQLALANKTKARAIYNAYKVRTEALPSGQRNRTLRTIRDALEQQFPGWQSDVLGVSGKLDRDRRIQLLYDAVGDPDLQDSPVTEPLRVYLAKRQQAFDLIAQRGGATTLGAQANEDIKNWLFDIGQALVTRDGNFQGIWQTVLSSEVE